MIIEKRRNQFRAPKNNFKDFTSREILSLIQKEKIVPKRKLGQNFVIKRETLDKIINVANIGSREKIIEIGPGIGNLTQRILQKKAEIISIELDRRFVSLLKKRFGKNKNFRLIHSDALKTIDRITKKITNYKIVANIPYRITSPLIKRILSLKNKPKLAILLIQKEVAERIVARPGDSRRGYLSVLVQLYGNPEIVDIISRDNFYPVPKVDSAIIKLRIKNQELRIKDDFLRIVQAGFSQKRKKIRNSLSSFLRLEPFEMDGILQNVRIDSGFRAEDLTLRQWKKLTCELERRKKF